MAGYNDSEGPYTQGAAGASTHLIHITDITNKFDKDATPTTGDGLTWDGTVYVPRSAIVYSPTDPPWNAPTNGTDATPALDAFFAAVPDGARCYIKRGTYTIQPGGDSHMVHLIRKNLEIFGDGKDATIIKVKNSAGNFISMFTNRTTGGSDTDISGLRIHDIGFDQNETGNAVASIPTLMGSMFRFVLRAAGVDKANDVIVERCRFSDTESVCNIIVTDNDNWVVRDNIFQGVGPGAFHDHSTINIRGNGTRIYNNQFIGVGLAAWTAVEPHGSDVRIYDNEITAYGRVGNACGTLVPGYHQYWLNNIGKTLMAGITIWAYTNMTAGDLTATQFAIEDMLIQDNQFEIDYDYWSSFTSNLRTGVELQVGSTASLTRVMINRNTVTYVPYTDTPTSTDNNSSGILWRRGGAVVTSGPGDEDIEITDNLVTNSLASAVQFEAFSTAKRIKIQRNTGVNPGSGAPAAGSKKLIDVISPTSRGFTVSDIWVENNTAVDTRGTHLMTGVVDLSAAELVVAGRYRDNTVRCADAAIIPATELPSSGDWTIPGDPYARNRLNATHRGLLAENFYLHTAATFTILPTAGLLNLCKIPFPISGPITNLYIYISVAGATLTSGQNFAMLYSTAGALLGTTATQHTAWQSTGLKTMALTTPYAAAAGDYYVAFYSNGTTLPTLARGLQSAGVNAGSLTPTFLWQTADSGLTTTPPSNIGAVTALANSWWVGLS